MDKRKRRLLCMLEGGGRKSRWISGVPPLSFKAKKAGTLENYRIYGNTVGGESVGDRTGNLFDGELVSGSFSPNDGTVYDSIYRVRSTLGNLIKSGIYTISCSGEARGVVIYIYDEHRQFLAAQSKMEWSVLPRTFSIEQNCFVRFAFADTSDGKTGDTHEITPNDIENVMLNEGSTALPYEPYGYKVPVTVSNGTDTLTTPIYLPEQIRKVGDEAEYIDYAEQKQHRVRKNLFDINNLEDHYDISIETGLPTQDSAYSYMRCAITTPITVSAGDYYLTFNENIAGEIGFIISVFENNTLISRTPGYYSGARIRISSGNNIYIGFYNQNVAAAIHPSDISNIMLNSGTEPLPYEPYIENVDLDVTLPALPTVTGTNVLSVGTAMQPSEIEVKGKIKAL